MENNFVVYQDEEGILRPMAFVTPLNDTGIMRVEDFAKTMKRRGDLGKLVVVNMAVLPIETIELQRKLND